MEGRGLFVLFIFRRAVPFWARILNRTWLFVWPWHHDWQASGQDNTEAQRHGQSAKCSKILKLYSSRCAMSRNASDVSVFSLHYFYIYFFFCALTCGEEFWFYVTGMRRLRCVCGVWATSILKNKMVWIETFCARFWVGGWLWSSFSVISN